MNRHVLVAFASFAVIAACNGGTVAVGSMSSTGEELQHTKNGGSTGDGKTCSWSNTALADQFPSSGTELTYTVGQSFLSLDGCNSCDCTAQGIMCTVKACVATCTQNGVTYPVGPVPSGDCNSCACTTSGQIACTTMGCGDGGTTSSDGGSGAEDGGYACPAIAKQCPDGSYVGPSGPNCDFVCPTTSCGTLSTNASDQVNQVINANLACTQDSDCEIIERDSNCFGECTSALAKSGDAAFQSAIANVNANQCAQFKSQGCTFALPPCVAPGTAHCSNKVCVETYP